ncbi:MAG TPA: GUN4 domain-containing protein [Nodosilinea sp.]|nr:GUN4 domain-containing protein [Nodosilinea sp.]
MFTSADSNLQVNLDDLSLLLNDEDWRGADQLTAKLLLQAVEQNQQGEAVRLEGDSPPRPAHLTTETLASIPCPLLHAIDDCWQWASGGQFGFSAQLRIYNEVLAAGDFDPTLNNWATPHPFFEEVGWLMLFPLRPVGFLRFYHWLEFDLEAPEGHLPALWYWQVPGLASLRMGGFLTGQGAGFGDLARLDAMMLRFTRCY